MIGIVIPVGPGREKNLTQCLLAIRSLGRDLPPVVLVGDGVGPDDLWATVPFGLPEVGVIELPKHVPGMEQPRNQGVRYLVGRWPEVTYVWFVDSDVVLEPWALDAMRDAIADGNAGTEPRILVGPYDWLPEGWRPESGVGWSSRGGLRNDPRWPAFDTNDPSHVFKGDLMAGLACFSGNLVWPIEEFQRTGGFWSELHHGRCEDGELGLRAVAMGVGISMVREARGYHLWHPVDTQLALARNLRDVPMLNTRHPWAEGAGVVMVDRDGKAFDVRCSGCGRLVPTIGWWEHAAACHE